MQILLQSAEHLNENGFLVCEVGESEQRLEALFPTLPFLWLEFNSGGSGVFLLSRDELIRSASVIQQAIEERSNVT